MNKKMIAYILGNVIKICGILMLLPCIISIIYKEQVGFYYLGVSLLSILIGILITLRKPDNTVFYLKEGCIITSLSWIVLSIMGCLPFYLSGEIPSFTDALFETISGFTTTGASILSDVEALTYTALFWRSFTHWIGGMGVLVFLLAIIPLSGGSHINIMRAESTGPSVGKLVPKIKHTARILYLIYFALTVIMIVFLLAGGMSVFDSFTTAFGTAGTGGFGIKNDSLMSYSPYIQWVVTIFMITFGINFNAFYLILFGQIKKAFSIEEVKCYLLIIFASITLIFISLLDTSASIFEALTHSSFQVASIITTSGFASTDFNLWSSAAKSILVLLMFIGACSGSTGGGIKVSRFIVAFKTFLKETTTYLHPKSVKKINMDGKPVEHEVIRSVNVYFVTFILLFCASVFLVSLEGKDLVTTFTAVTATINNIGPGLELAGPTSNFGHFTDFSKWVMMFDMLAGRLELFPLIMLFHPHVLKEFFSFRKKS